VISRLIFIVSKYKFEIIRYSQKNTPIKKINRENTIRDNDDKLKISSKNPKIKLPKNIIKRPIILIVLKSKSFLKLYKIKNVNKKKGIPPIEETGVV
tara:strand:- start:230 stop:520 length:291 start_codon:yes stop_codon:yes gene_type:complete